MANKDLMSPERLALIQHCVDEGWPLVQITQTHKVNWKTLKKYFPDYRGMAKGEAARLGAQGRKTSIALRHMNRI